MRYFTVIFLIWTSNISFGQEVSYSYYEVEATRLDFFRWRLGQINLENSKSEKSIIRISGQRLSWDTTRYVYIRFLAPYDTTDKSDLSIKSLPTKRKIVLMQKLLNGEYGLIKKQILNQYVDKFISQEILTKKIRASKKKGDVFYFSQPLVFNRGKSLVVIERRKSAEGYESKACILYNREFDKWINQSTLESEAYAIQ